MNNFDLKKYLIENKLTRLSKQLNESVIQDLLSSLESMKSDSVKPTDFELRTSKRGAKEDGTITFTFDLPTGEEVEAAGELFIDEHPHEEEDTNSYSSGVISLAVTQAKVKTADGQDIELSAEEVQRLDSLLMNTLDLENINSDYWDKKSDYQGRASALDTRAEYERDRRRGL